MAFRKKVFFYFFSSWNIIYSFLLCRGILPVLPVLKITPKVVNHQMSG